MSRETDDNTDYEYGDEEGEFGRQGFLENLEDESESDYGFHELSVLGVNNLVVK